MGFTFVSCLVSLFRGMGGLLLGFMLREFAGWLSLCMGL